MSSLPLKIINRILIVFIIALLLFLTHFKVQSWNDASRFATIEQLVDNHTFVIDQSSFQTGDKVFISGFFYSDKPPLFSVLASVPYFFLNFFDYNFVNNESFLIYITTLFTSTIPFLLFFVFLYILLRKEIFLEKEKFIFLLIAVSMGTAMLPFATVFNNHLSAGILCGAAVLLILYKNIFNKFLLLLIGALFGLAITIDPGSLFIALCFSIYILYILLKQIRGQKQNIIYHLSFIIYFFVGLVLPIYFHWLFNLQITGNILPASMHPEFFNYLGSPFATNNLTGASLAVGSFGEWIKYVYLMLFGKRGFLLHNPLIIFALVGVVFMVLKKGNKEKKLFYLLSLISYLLVILYYSLFGKGAGGPTYIVRWFIIIIPLFTPILIEIVNTYRNKIFNIIIILSFITAIWNIPAATVVYKNINKYPDLNMVSAIKLFPKNIFVKSKEWKKLFGR